MASLAMERARLEAWSDEQVVQRVLAGQVEVFEILMRRYNSRLYRVAVSITRNPAEAEDVVQDAYVRAYTHLRQYEARAPFATWLTRIAVHEALARSHKQSRFEPIGDDVEPEAIAGRAKASPEQHASDTEVTSLLEETILRLPAKYCTILIMRDVQEMDTAETAECLGISEENVKVRLHRARALLRRELYAYAGANVEKVFGFDGERCDRIVARVFERIGSGA